jgi:cytochrome b subunit of formate dehydrogenase
MGTAMERGAFGSVIRGDISAKWAQRYHGVWYEEITRGSANRK